MDFILQVCKVEEKDLVHHCDVNKVFLDFQTTVSNNLTLISMYTFPTCLK